jgi:hypothetical protein
MIVEFYYFREIAKPGFVPKINLSNNPYFYVKELFGSSRCVYGGRRPGIFLVYPKYNEFQGIEQQKEEKIAEMKNRREYYADLGLVAADLDRYRDNFKKSIPPCPTSRMRPQL